MSPPARGGVRAEPRIRCTSAGPVALSIAVGAILRPFVGGARASKSPTFQHARSTPRVVAVVGGAARYVVARSWRRRGAGTAEKLVGNFKLAAGLCSVAMCPARSNRSRRGTRSLAPQAGCSYHPRCRPQPDSAGLRPFVGYGGAPGKFGSGSTPFSGLFSWPRKSRCGMCESGRRANDGRTRRRRRAPCARHR